MPIIIVSEIKPTLRFNKSFFFLMETSTTSGNDKPLISRIAPAFIRAKEIVTQKTPDEVPTRKNANIGGMNNRNVAVLCNGPPEIHTANAIAVS